MSPNADAHKRTVRQYPLAVAAGDLDVLEDLCTEDVVSHAPLGEPRGIDAHKDYERPIHQAFPNFDVAFDDIVAEGNRVAMRFTIQATHRGELMGVAPTGRPIEFQNVVFNRMVDGKIAERWVQPQLFELMVQLGVVDDPRR